MKIAGSTKEGEAEIRMRSTKAKSTVAECEMRQELLNNRLETKERIARFRQSLRTPTRKVRVSTQKDQVLGGLV